MTFPFWRKPLSALTETEWESLCDGCGRCCLVKLEDEDTAEVHYTDVACTLFDAGSCGCSNYPERQARVPDCVKLTPEALDGIAWLPPSCAYRLVAEGRDLMWWHWLVSGDRETIHAAGVSVRGQGSGVGRRRRRRRSSPPYRQMAESLAEARQKTSRLIETPARRIAAGDGSVRLA